MAGAFIVIPDYLKVLKLYANIPASILSRPRRIRAPVLERRESRASLVKNNAVKNLECQMSQLILMQGYLFFAFTEINQPVAEYLKDCKQVIASDYDHHARVGQGMGSKPVIPLGKAFAILFPQVIVPTFSGTHGPWLQDIIADAVADHQV